MITKAIFGIKYSYLSNEEILFIKKYHPYGIIFFERNIESINQFKSLINHIKSLVNYDLLFVIDHEGGKINRFNKIQILHIVKLALISKDYDDLEDNMTWENIDNKYI